jgi:DNA polymerase-3 subunit epsilon
MTFTAIDFETAHPKRWSICQVGLGKNYELLIINYELKARIAIHNSAFIIYNSLPRVWHELKPFIQDEIVVAHNIGLKNYEL